VEWQRGTTAPHAIYPPGSKVFASDVIVMWGDEAAWERGCMGSCGRRGGRITIMEEKDKSVTFALLLLPFS